MAFSSVVVAVVVEVAVAVGVGVAVGVAVVVVVVVVVVVAVAVAVGVAVAVVVGDVNNERRRHDCLWTAVLRCGLSSREDVEMISWTDEAIEAALDSFYGPNWRGKYQETNNEMRNDMRLALDAAAEAQTAAEFPGFKEWALEGEYHRGRAEALEEAARYVEQIWAAGFGPSAVTAAIRALKEKQG